MSDPLSDEAIARAMKRSVWIAEHGTREERAGRFLVATPGTLVKKTQAASAGRPKMQTKR